MNDANKQRMPVPVTVSGLTTQQRLVRKFLITCDAHFGALWPHGKDPLTEAGKLIGKSVKELTTPEQFKTLCNRIKEKYPIGGNPPTPGQIYDLVGKMVDVEHSPASIAAEICAFIKTEKPFSNLTDPWLIAALRHLEKFQPPRKQFVRDIEFRVRSGIDVIKAIVEKGVEPYEPEPEEQPLPARTIRDYQNIEAGEWALPQHVVDAFKTDYLEQHQAAIKEARERGADPVHKVALGEQVFIACAKNALGKNYNKPQHLLELSWRHNLATAPVSVAKALKDNVQKRFDMQKRAAEKQAEQRLDRATSMVVGADRAAGEANE